MKSKQIKQGLWKDRIVYVDGFVGRVITKEPKNDRFLIEFLSDRKLEWFDNEFIVWD